MGVGGLESISILKFVVVGVVVPTREEQHGVRAALYAHTSKLSKALFALIVSDVACARFRVRKSYLAIYSPCTPKTFNTPAPGLTHLTPIPATVYWFCMCDNTTHITRLLVFFRPRARFWQICEKNCEYPPPPPPPPSYQPQQQQLQQHQHQCFFSLVCYTIYYTFGEEKVARYKPRGYFKLHTDHVEAFNDLACGGRLGTLIVYLNDDFTGGQTQFPYLEVTVQPSAGDAIYFHSVRVSAYVHASGALLCHTRPGQASSC